MSSETKFRIKLGAGLLAITGMLGIAIADVAMNTDQYLPGITNTPTTVWHHCVGSACEPLDPPAGDSHGWDY